MTGKRTGTALSKRVSVIVPSAVPQYAVSGAITLYKGAYWEDRYHATALETDRHLLRCLIYVDMNIGTRWSRETSCGMAL